MTDVMTGRTNDSSTELHGDAAQARVDAPRAPSAALPPRLAQPSLILGSLVVLLVSAWAGIAPFVGPTFGYSPDASASWTWNRVHVLGGAVPGAVGVLACLMIMMIARRPTGTLAPSALTGAGILLFLTGAWLAAFPVVWPVLVGTYLQPASPLLNLAYWMGPAIGPGLVLACFGAFTAGRAGKAAYGAL